MGTVQTLFVLAMVATTCILGAAATQRVRREIRSLTETEREDIFRAMHVLKFTSTETGRQKYGTAYLSYDDFVAKHFRAAAFPGCDQAHLGSGFATCEFERGLP